METTVKERLIKYLSFKKISQRKFEINVGLSNGYVNNINKSIQPDKIQNIALCFPDLNAGWLLTGEGEMLKGSGVVRSVDIEKVIYPLRPHFSAGLSECGRPGGFSVAVKKDDCDHISIPFLKDYDFSITATGDSMINRTDTRKSIRGGDILACKIVKSRSHIRYGEIYTISTLDGYTTKRIVKSELENHVRCESFNTEEGYTPFELPIEEIFDWAFVVGIARITQL